MQYGYFTKYYLYYQIPKSIVSNKDKVFINLIYHHLFKLQGTSLAMSSTYHPNQMVN